MTLLVAGSPLTNSSSFVPVSSNVDSFALGYLQGLVLKEGGEVWSFKRAEGGGHGKWGQDGTGTYPDWSPFTKIETKGAGVAAGDHHSLIVTDAGFGITEQPRPVTGDAGINTFLRVVAVGGSLTYQWQRSSDNGATWANVGGGTSNLLRILSLDPSKTGLYRVVVTSGSESEASRVVKVAIGLSGPQITAQPQSQTITERQSVTFSVAVSGSGNTYQWYRIKPGVAYAQVIAGATGASFTDSDVVWDDRGEYYVRITNANGVVNSEKATLTVTPLPPVITAEPVDTTVNSGNFAKISVVASGIELGFQWYRGEPGSGELFGSYNGGSSYFGSPQRISEISWYNVTPAQAGKYYVVVSNAGGSVTSKAATLTVRSIPVVTTHPVSLSINPGTTASFTAAAAGEPTPTVQWQVSTDAGSTWTNISGATSASYSFTASGSDHDKRFRAVFTNSLGVTSTNAATLSVNALPAVVTQPANAEGIVGATFNLTADFWGRPDPSGSWEVSADSGATWNDAGGGQYYQSVGANRRIGFSRAIQVADAGRQFRAKATNAAGTVYSNAVTITVLSGPAITSQPASVAVTEGGTASFSVAFTGTPIPSVQWQSSPDGATWTNLPSGTLATYTHNAALSESGKRFRAILNNAYGSVTSSVATLTVNTFPKITSQPNDVLASVGATAAFAATVTGTPTPSATWEQSVNGGATWTTVGTGTTYSLLVGAGDHGKKFRVTFTNSVGSVTSDTVTLSVASSPTVTTQPSSISRAVGANVTFTVAAAGVPVPTVKWQVSSDGNTFADIPGATSLTYAFAVAADDNGKRYRAVFTNSSGSATSTAATLTVTSAPSITAQPSPVAVTTGTTAAFNAAATGLPAPTVQWQVSVAGGAFTNIPGATSTSYSFATSVGDNGKKFRAVFTNGTGTATTEAVLLTVNPAPTPTPTPTPIPTATPTPTPTATPTPSPTPTVTPTPTPVPTATPTPTPTPTATPTPLPTASPTPLPTATPTPTPKPTATPTPKPTATPTPSPTATPTPKPTATPTPTVTPSPTPQPTATPTPVPTATPSPTPSPTATPTPVPTATPVPAVAPKITKQPTLRQVTVGQTATFTAAASGTPAPAVQWQQSTDNGATWTNVSGANSLTLSVSATLSQNGTRYRAVFTNPAGQAVTVGALLSVKAPTLTSLPVRMESASL
ncbi:MAG: hypothetical protein SFV32_12915 [Opitutaceae bacterium]|nr:hypothetical protein [Opitutaceae bacterium]